MRAWFHGGAICVITGCTSGSGGATPDSTTDDVTVTTPTTDTDTAPTSCYASGPTTVLGTGDTGYVPLNSGDEIMVVHGAQGGWHLATAARVSGVSDIAQFVPSAAFSATGEPVAGVVTPENREFTDYDAEACTGSVWNVRAYVGNLAVATGDLAAFVCTLEGAAVTLRVQVTDLTTGLATEATAEVTTRVDPADLAECP